MIKRDNNISLAIGGPALAMQIGGYVIANYGNAVYADLGLALEAVGTILLVVGLCYYARAKGRHMAWGLFGLLSWIGIIVLACLGDRAKLAPVPYGAVAS